MFRASAVVVLFILTLSGCGKGETHAERRQREAVDLCYKAQDCLKANKKAEAESLFRRAVEVDPFCEKAFAGLARMKQEQEAISAAKAAVSMFETPLEAYHLHMGAYPSSHQGLTALRNPPANAGSNWLGPYVKTEIPLDPWSRPYRYESPGRHNPDSYDLWSAGPDGMQGTADHIGNW